MANVRTRARLATQILWGIVVLLIAWELFDPHLEQMALYPEPVDWATTLAHCAAFALLAAFLTWIIRSWVRTERNPTKLHPNRATEGEIEALRQPLAVAGEQLNAPVEEPMEPPEPIPVEAASPEARERHEEDEVQKEFGADNVLFTKERFEAARKRLKEKLGRLQRGPNVQGNLTKADEDAIWLFRRRCAFVWWLHRAVGDAICDGCNHLIDSPQGYLIGGTLICDACAARWRSRPTGPDDLNPGELPKARESAEFVACAQTSTFGRAALNGEIDYECLNAVRSFWRHCAFVARLFEFPVDMVCAKCKREQRTGSGYLNVRWAPPLPEYSFYCSQCIDQVLNPDTFCILNHMEEGELEFLKEFAELKP